MAKDGMKRTWTVTALLSALWAGFAMSAENAAGRYVIEFYGIGPSGAPRQQAALRGTLILLPQPYDLRRAPPPIRGEIEDQSRYTTLHSRTGGCFLLSSEPSGEMGFRFARRGLTGWRVSESGDLEFGLSASPDAGYFVRLHSTQSGFEGQGQWRWGSANERDYGQIHTVRLKRIGSAAVTDCDKLWSSKR